MTSQILNGCFGASRALAGRGLCSSLLVLLALGAVPAGAALITVDDPGDGSGTTCSLNNAINSANTDTSIGNCTAGSGDDEIKLAVDVVLAESLSNAINSNVTLNGNSHILDGQGLELLRITSGNVTVKNITIQNGSAGTGAGGGAILKLTGTLSIDNSTFISNTAPTGGSLGSPGGAVQNVTGNLEIKNSTFNGNSSSTSGGAISSSGPVQIYKCTFGYDDTSLQPNQAGASGGAIGILNSTLLVQDSTFDRGNALSGGGAIYITASTGNTATVILERNTFSRNQAGPTSKTGGAIYVAPATGGIVDVTLSYNTIVKNLIAGPAAQGAGIYISGTLTTSTLNGNLIASNTSGTTSGKEIYIASGTPAPTTNYNLWGFSGESAEQAFSNFTTGSTDICATSTQSGNCTHNPTPLANIIVSAALVNPLDWNGGPTQTIALVEGSNNPAIDAIPTSASGTTPPCSSTDTKTLDQRGYNRANGNGYTSPGANPNQCNVPDPGYGNGFGTAGTLGCDIGAYEFIAQNVCTLESYSIIGASYYEDNRNNPVTDTKCTPGTPSNLRYGRYRITTDWTPTIDMKNIVFKVRNIKSKNGTVPSNYMVNFNPYKPAVTPVPRVGSTYKVTGTKSANSRFTTTFDIARCSTSGFYFFVDMFADPTVQTGYGLMSASATESQPSDEIVGQMRLYIDEEGQIRTIKAGEAIEVDTANLDDQYRRLLPDN